jgi:hypothetical protein
LMGITDIAEMSPTTFLAASVRGKHAGVDGDHRYCRNEPHNSLCSTPKDPPVFSTIVASLSLSQTLPMLASNSASLSFSEQA